MEPTSRAPGRESLDISPCQALQSGDLGVKRPWVSVLPQGTCRRARATLPIFSRGPPIRAESHRCAPLLQGLTPLTTTCIGGPKCGPCYGVAGTWQAMDSSACMSETKDRHFVAPERVPPMVTAFSLCTRRAGMRLGLAMTPGEQEEQNRGLWPHSVRLVGQHSWKAPCCCSVPQKYPLEGTSAEFLCLVADLEYLCPESTCRSSNPGCGCLINQTFPPERLFCSHYC